MHTEAREFFTHAKQAAGIEVRRAKLNLKSKQLNLRMFELHELLAAVTGDSWLAKFRRHMLLDAIMEISTIRQTVVRDKLRELDIESTHLHDTPHHEPIVPQESKPMWHGRFKNVSEGTTPRAENIRPVEEHEE